MNLQNTIDRINKTNSQFKKANKARRRVIIAQDVIFAINAEELKSDFGYISSNGSFNPIKSA